MRIHLLSMLLVASCSTAPDEEEATVEQALSPQLQRGKDLWFKATFGGEKFFTVILPGPPFNLALGLDTALTSPRATRFNTFGLLNDPDCVQGDASSGFLDKCTDPESAGVIGVRKKIVNGQLMLGVACASCHAGLDPQRPATDPNRPTWNNIHATVGNQYIQIGKLFGAHLAPNDPRRQVFNTWAPGTVDTTAIESDGINNPGIITQFFNLDDRPFFDLTDKGVPITTHRNGQGGEDDATCEKAALRVYFNIGMCAGECMVGHLANGPGGTSTPIDDAECSARCPEYVQAKTDVVDLCAFMASTTPPKLAASPGGSHFVDHSKVQRGRHVFAAACAGCHSNGESPPHDVLSDDEVHPAALIGTNSCRARTTNWATGRIWANFSSDQYKARGPGFYRNVPLLAAWATAPFLHNNRLGLYNGDPSVAGRIAAYEDAMDQLLNPWKRDFIGSIQRTTTPITVGTTTLPAGTPVALFSNGDRCLDIFENQGHYFGAFLSPSDKRALTEYLKTR